MKKLLLLPYLLSIFVADAQNTSIPDSNFEQALISLFLDTVADGQVLTSNINTVTFLNVSNKNITDLTGIQGFVLLDSLECSINQLTSLDLSQNTALTRLWCSTNAITSLDLTQNTALTHLNCENNQLTFLDLTMSTQLFMIQCWSNSLTNLNVSQNTSLNSLDCGYNSITELNLSQNSALSFLSCSDNQLTCLNVKNGNNSSMTSAVLFDATNNSSLTCIDVDNVSFSTTTWTNIDVGASFSLNCGTPCAVGIDELSSSSINIYPNPSSGQLTISLEEASKGVISIRNYIGQIVMKQEFDNTQELNINLDGPSGIYFLQVESDGQVITKKVVKQ